MKKLVITFAAAAAIVVSAAQSADNRIVSPDDRWQSRATALLPSSTSPDDRAFSRAVSPALQSSTEGPDDRAVSRATIDLPEPTPVLQSNSQGPDDRAVSRATVDLPTPTPVQVIVRQPHGFDWTAATTGAAAGTGFAAILAALSLLAVRSRRSAGPGTPTVESA
jgi:hypothetical protein